MQLPEPEVLISIAALVTTIAAIFSACAWPLTLLLLLILFREPILRALPNLKRFKAAGVELEFAERVLQLERKAAAAEIPPLDQAIKDVAQPDVIWLYSLAEMNARSAVIEAWLLVESSIVYALARVGMEPPKAHTRSLYYLLYQLPVEFPHSRELFDIVFELRELRNKAVHEVEFALGLDETVHYINLSIRVSNMLRRLRSSGK